MDASPELLFGRLAIDAGYLAETQVNEILGEQARRAKQGNATTLGAICLSRGLLNERQIESILLAQHFAEIRTEDRRFGALAVRNGFVTAERVEEALRRQKKEYSASRELPRRLGEFLMEMGVLTPQQVSALLKAQERLQTTSRVPRPNEGARVRPSTRVLSGGEVRRPFNYVFRSKPLIPLPADAPRRSGKVTCPHCWHHFPVEDTLFVARHRDLVGDPVLGQDAPLRFLPSRFTPQGNAIDPEGLESPDRACPRCHLRLPASSYDCGSLFLSIVGAPGSGKSYYLTSAIWEMRTLLSREFCFLFADADAQTNQWLNAYEETLFVGGSPDKPVYLKKTELQGEAYTPVVLEGMPVLLPRPSIFTLRPTDRHRRQGRVRDTLARNLVLYDNAGEHFQPGMDSSTNPGTQHLSRSQAVLFLLDPTRDSRFMAELRRQDPTIPATVERPQRQDVLLTEIIQRIRRYRGLASGARTDLPLLVVASKFDVWRGLLGYEPPERPHRLSASLSTAALDMDAIATASLHLRELLSRTCPDIVSLAEAFSRQVFYVPVSALGHSPQLGPDGAYMVRPGDIRPWWVSVPFLYVLGQAGFVPVMERESPEPGVEAAEVERSGDQLTVRVPGTRTRHTLPLSYAGCTVRCPATGTSFRIPPLVEEGPR